MREIITKTRTFRRFFQKEAISLDAMHELVDVARLGGSARNGQPWQYMIINTPELCEKVFPFLGWAGYLSDWKGPVEGERPSGYILCLLNKNRLKGPESEAQFDLGVATQNLLLVAMEQRIGGCRIASVSPKLAGLFQLPAHLSISLVVALGRPRETIILEECQTDSDIKYWRDDEGGHHVPKRSLDSCLVTLDLVA